MTILHERTCCLLALAAFIVYQRKPLAGVIGYQMRYTRRPWFDRTH